MKRFFVPSPQINGDITTICGRDVNHIKNVLRMKTGDKIVIFDDSGNEYNTEIVEISKNEIKIETKNKHSNKSEPDVKVTIAQGLPKNPKMDLIIQKCTELGAVRIIPVQCERSVVKLDKSKGRWNKIAQSASQQSGRQLIPEICSPALFDDVCESRDKYDLKLILWEEEKENKFKDVLSNKPKAESIIVLIGPEGGFSIEEAALAKKKGFIPVTLGPRILRTETAGLAALSIIMYEFE